MDPHAAFALLLGLGATTTTADPISAILFGVPGHAASAATTLDGYPLTDKGQAGRALGASYMSALMGGLFGAALMGISAADGAAVHALHRLARAAVARRVRHLHGGGAVGQCAACAASTGACFGVMLAMVGADPQTGTLRWTMDSSISGTGCRWCP